MSIVRILIAYVGALFIFGFIWLGLDPSIAAAHGNYSASSLESSGAVVQSTKVSVKSCADIGQKIDLNNANMVDFMDCPGFYPTLAKSIVLEGPYARVEDVLEIADLSPQQKDMLEKNIAFFTVTDPVRPIEMRMPPRPSMRANP